VKTGLAPWIVCFSIHSNASGKPQVFSWQNQQGRPLTGNYPAQTEPQKIMFNFKQEVS